MKKLLVLALAWNGALLSVWLWQGLFVSAAAGPGAATQNGDVNGDGTKDLSDAIYLLRFLFTGGPPPVAIAQEGGLTGDEIALLREVLPHLSAVELADGKGGKAKTLRFTGVNLQIVNGLGATNGNPADPASFDPTAVNGLGNLIIGYEERRFPSDESDVRTGSHNLIVGASHGYSSFGGIVSGYSNTVSGTYSSVTGGTSNTASGEFSSVSGGAFNTASARGCSVSGGGRNTAGISDAGEEGYSSVVGGFGNSALGSYCTVSGGSSNEAEEYYTSVSGGFYNVAGEYAASVSGGSNNRASGDLSSVSGGIANTASGPGSSISGGGSSTEDLQGGNTASGRLSSVSGGSANAASGEASSISGGHFHNVLDPHNWQAGNLFETE
jgi:hypothetical protein